MPGVSCHMQRAMCRASPNGIILTYDNDRSHSFVNSPCWLTPMRCADPLRVVAKGHKGTARRAASGHLNHTFYERFYIDELEVAGDEKTRLFTEIHQAAADYRRVPRNNQQESPRVAEAFLTTTSTDLLSFSDLFSVKGSSKAVMVGRAGLEPATNGLPIRVSQRFSLWFINVVAQRISVTETTRRVSRVPADSRSFWVNKRRASSRAATRHLRRLRAKQID